MTEISNEEYLKTLSEELHKPMRKNFQRRSVISRSRNEIWASDISDLSMYTDANDGYKYILVVMDVWSRKSFACACKTKDAKTVANYLETLIKEIGAPKKMWCDKGSEFYNKSMDVLIKKYKITRYSTFGGLYKVSVIERLQRTLKSEMVKRFTKLRTHNWVDMLPTLIQWYNNKEHSSIKTTPTKKYESWNGEEEKKSEKQIKKEMRKSMERETKFKINDKVRISGYKNVFAKGYTPSWSDEIYTIDSISLTADPSEPEMYQLKDRNGEVIQGSFYKEELQKTELDSIFLIEEILKEKKVRGKKQYFVKWLGYPQTYNSWVNEDDMFDVRS